jgi:cytoskeletal protein CcmA (bactofilin family)
MADSNDNAGGLIVGEGVQATGTFVIPGRAIINGSIEGELTAKEIHVGPSGKAVGRFEAEVAAVHGEVHDTLVATATLKVYGTGRVVGALFYREIEIERGGKIEGTMSQGSPNSAAPRESAVGADSSRPAPAQPAPRLSQPDRPPTSAESP